MAQKIPTLYPSKFAIDLSETDKDEIETWIGQRITAAVSGMATRDENITHWRAVYADEKWSRDAALRNGANLRINLVAEMVDATLVRLTQSHFGIEPYVRVLPMSSELSDIAGSSEQWLQYLHSLQSIVETGFLTIQDSMIAGYGITKVHWLQQYERVNFDGKESNVLLYNLPTTEYIPAEEFYVYPTDVKSIDRSQICGHRTYLRWDEIVRGSTVGKFNPEWITQIEQKAPGETTDDETERTEVGTDKISWEEVYYRIMELVVRYDHDDDGLEEMYLVFFDEDNQKIIGFHRYPYAHSRINYVPYVHAPTKGWMGRSLVQELEDLDQELCTLHNMRIDNGALMNLGIFTVLMDSPAAKDDEAWYSGKKIPVNDHEDMKQLFKTDQMGSFRADEEQIIGLARVRSGVSELLSGQVPKGEKTAYEIESALAEGSIKFRLMVIFGLRWLKEIAWQELALTKQFLDDADETFQRVTGQHNFLVEMPWQDIIDKFDIVPMGNTTTNNRELERQKMVFLREMFKQDPLVLPPPNAAQMNVDFSRWWELDRLVLESSGIHNHVAIIGPKPEPPAPPPIAPGQPPGGQPAAPAGMPPEAGAAQPPPELLAAINAAASGGAQQEAPLEGE